MSGPIPAELGSLVNLEWLDISSAWGLSGPLPVGLERSNLETLDAFVTQTCAPPSWRGWLATIESWVPLCGSGPDVTVDVAVVYTPAAREEAGGTAEIAAVIDLMIAETNQAYADSGVGHRVALVASSEVAYTEVGDERDLRRLQRPSDGYMDEVHDMRDRTGADLVHLIFKWQDHPFAGFALWGRPFGATCQNCGGVTFAHELGHNMGLSHDRYDAYGDGDSKRRHPAYGYVNQRAFEAGADESSRWHTLMAYGTQCGANNISCSPLLRFSNPRQEHNGDPLGVAYGVGGTGVGGPADAVAVLEFTGPTVALWRDPPPRAVGNLPDRWLPLGGRLDVDVSRAFDGRGGGPLTYSASSSAPDVVRVRVSGARVTLTAVGEGRAVVGVTATDQRGLSASRSFTVTVSSSPPFTDDPIVAGVTPTRAIHFTELRTRIDALREAGGLGRFSWTDPGLVPGVTPIRLVHLLELRSALAAAYATAGRTPPSWTDARPVAGATRIRAAHLTELRAAVVALEE